MTLMIEAEHEAIAREALERLRQGGPEFRIALAILLEQYVPRETALTIKKID